MNKILIVAALSAFGTAHAAQCNVSDVRITSVAQYSDASPTATLSTITASDFSTDAAACAGAFIGNDGFYPQINLGYSGDGLLNGGTQVASGNVLFSNGAFISEQYPAQDLKGDGTADDPGWIMLGKYEANKLGEWVFSPSSLGIFDDIVLSTFFSATRDGSGKGTWEFTPDATAAARAAKALGNNWFDQFAVVFKAGNGFAVYDFTPDLFGASAPLASDPIMNWYGTYDVSKTLTGGGGNAAGLSHISLWARDPSSMPDTNIPTTNVPEPTSLALLGLGLVGLLASRKRPA
ncbi:MAG: PEP-CTERM sorting domain-containing protein [Betaproteobacteria bacterium HGW-Betaproteobacteria-21]|nr:MAG: PEP-CTERM sorting domain-containing protein [Betaproteobacteria bacterium HGW-Betaproteobacteria-21]